MTYQRFLLIGILCLPSCVTPLQGPEIDLVAVATPPPIPEPPRLAPGPTPKAGSFRAWIPRQIQPNGDESEGHWATISLTPPAAEVMEPAKPMPRSPKASVSAKPKPTAVPQTPTEPFTTPSASNSLRTPAASTSRPFVGGQ